MAKLHIPRATTTALNNAVPLAGELIYNEDKHLLVYGDGHTEGGVELAASPALYTGPYVYGIDVTDGVGPIAPRAHRVILTDMESTVPKESDYTVVDRFLSMPCHHLRRCVMADNATRTVAYYLNDSDSSLKEDGTSADLTGADGDVFVEFPVSWCRIDHYTADNVKHTVRLISTEPFSNSEPHPFFYVSPSGTELRTQYIGAFPASRATDGKLHSISGVKPAGCNSAVVDIQAAESNGACVVNFLYRVWLGWLIEIEFASSDSQAAVSDGFVWLTGISDSDYSACRRNTGRTAVFGNRSGEIVADPVIDSDLDGRWTAGKPHIVQMSYRGLEDVWGGTFESVVTAKYFEDSDFTAQGGLWITAATSRYGDLAAEQEPLTDVVIMDKTYPVCKVGQDEIGQLWTSENLNLGEFGRYYDDDETIGEIQGSLIAPDQVKILDSRLRGIAYNPAIDGRFSSKYFIARLREVGSDDFELIINFKRKSTAAGEIFRWADNADSLFAGISAVTDGVMIHYHFVNSTEVYTSVESDNDFHEVKFTRAAGRFILSYDGTVLKDLTGEPIDASALADSVSVVSTADCEFGVISLSDKNGEILWAINGTPVEHPVYCLPSEKHLLHLATLAGGEAIAGRTLRSSGSEWTNATEATTGTDKFGFNALPAGYLTGSSFTGLGEVGYFLTDDGKEAHLSGADNALTVVNASATVSSSVRCLKTRSSVFLGNRRYPTVLIGDQWWTAENLSGFGGTHITPQSELYGDYYDSEQLHAVDTQLKEAGSTYRVPRLDEYQRLAPADTPLKPLKSRIGWTDDLIGTNQTGFDILSSGLINNDGRYGAGAFYLVNITPHSIAGYYKVLTGDNETHLNAYYTVFINERKASIRLVRRFHDVLIFGRMHRFVKIGDQYWDTENLDYAGADGTLGRYYNNDATLGALYGRMYTPAELVSLEVELAATGLPFAIPDKADITGLAGYNNGSLSNQGGRLKSTDGWTSGAGTDEYEFSCLPGGEADGDNFSQAGTTAGFYVTVSGGYAVERMTAAGSAITAGADIPADNTQIASYVRLIYKLK